MRFTVKLKMRHADAAGDEEPQIMVTIILPPSKRLHISLRFSLIIDSEFIIFTGGYGDVLGIHSCL